MNAINLQVNPVAQQLSANVEDIYKAISTAYHIHYQERHTGSGVCIEFGVNPIKGNFVQYQPFAGKATVMIRNVKNSLLTQIFGMNDVQICEHARRTRKEQGNDVANALPSTVYQAKLDAVFGLGVVSMNINEYHAGVSVVVDISSLNDVVIHALSTILMHSELTPKAQKQTVYHL